MINSRKTIYIDLTALCDRHWTGVEQFAYLFSKTLPIRFPDMKIINLVFSGVKENIAIPDTKNFVLGKKHCRIITDYLLFPLFILIYKPEYIVFPVITPARICWLVKSKRTEIITVIHDMVTWKYRDTMSAWGKLLAPRCNTALKMSYQVITVSETEKAALKQINPYKEYSETSIEDFATQC